jgi:hypothetical protein
VSAEPELLFEGRPHGYIRPGPWDFLAYGAIAALGLLMLGHVIQAASMPVVTWDWTWGVIKVTGTSLPAPGTVMTSLSVSGPNPLAWFLAIAGLDVFRWVALRGQVFRLRQGVGLEVERGLVWRGVTVHAMRGDEHVEVVPRGATVLRAADAPLLLVGLDAQDASSLESALRRLHPPG